LRQKKLDERSLAAKAFVYFVPFVVNAFYSREMKPESPFGAAPSNSVSTNNKRRFLAPCAEKVER